MAYQGESEALKLMDFCEPKFNCHGPLGRISLDAKIPIAAAGDSVIIMQLWVVLTQCDGQFWPLAILWQNRVPPSTCFWKEVVR